MYIGWPTCHTSNNDPTALINNFTRDMPRLYHSNIYYSNKNDKTKHWIF